jgi:hypothetical protein
MVPTVNTPIGTARAVAKALGRPFVAPTPRGLQTFDASHLDSVSAERWSDAFLTDAAAGIRKCFAEDVDAGSDAVQADSATRPARQGRQAAS